MSIGLLKIVGLTGFVVAAAMAIHGPSAASDARSTAALTGTATSVPFGWVDFCERYVGECDGPALRPTEIAYTAKAAREIATVNRTINAAIVPVSDQDHWNVVDRWDYPTDGRGDCEDYALLKRRVLMAAGYPRQALLMTVVKDLEGEGHAILTVKTSAGDFVLDNLVDEPKPWEQTGYRFVKRQSQEDPNTWVTIQSPTAAVPITVAARRHD